jgi:histidine triad (HIT) family protein
MSIAYDNNNVFAKILRGEIPCHKVYEDDMALAFMDIMPRIEGHVLVIPKSPARTLFDIDPKELGELIQRVQKVARAAKDGLGAEGVSVMQFNESAGGQVIFHLHFHILPRWEGVELRPAHNGRMEEPKILEENRAKIVAALKS